MYNEALGRAKSHYNTAIQKGDVNKLQELENIFPELKDEGVFKRMRKLLYDCRYNGYHKIDDHEYTEYLEWLKIVETRKIKNIRDGALKDSALSFMNWLDENRFEGKMCLSNMECEDIEDVFLSHDWCRMFRYIKKMCFEPTNTTCEIKCHDCNVVADE